MSLNQEFAIACRRSPLARIQARHVGALLAEVSGRPQTAFPLRAFVSSGDKNLSTALADLGGKGLFTREVEAALFAGKARFAVHSMKDMPAQTPPGLVLAATPAREDPRDCFISAKAATPWALAHGATVGAASVRRIAQVRARRRDIKTTLLRGNVQTRLDKLAQGVADGTFLAAAGLNRLGLQRHARQAMDPAEMLPAPGQGALYVQTRENDHEARELAAQIACAKTRICVAVERAFLAALDGSCRTPIAGLCVIEKDALWFRGELLALDGSTRFTAERRMAADVQDLQGAAQMGREAGDEIRRRAGAAFLDQLTAR